MQRNKKAIIIMETRGVGAKLEVVRQILKLLASFMIRTGAKCSYICSYLKLPKATQLPC